PTARLPPLVDVPLAGVMSGQRGPLVPVLVEQVAQVPGAVADVDLGVVEILYPELRPSRVDSDSLRRVRKQLHQSDRPRARLHVRAKLALLVDHRGQQGGVEVVVPSVAPDDRVVLERIPEANPPAGL